MSLTMICPSRGRPDNVAELVALWPEVTEAARLVIVVDFDDPARSRYRCPNNPDGPLIEMRIVAEGARNLGGILNQHAMIAVRAGASHVGFLGDDHRPRTFGWDRLLVDALGGKPGVAYGDDLAQGENLPTACVIDAEVIAGLRYMCPPGVQHLYLDDFWKQLGTDLGNLAYHPGVVIEHMHPAVGKAETDDGYRRVNSPDRYAADRDAYVRFICERWPADLDSLKHYLSEPARLRRQAIGMEIAGG